MEEENPAFIVHVAADIEKGRRVTFKKKPLGGPWGIEEDHQSHPRHDLNLTLRHDLNLTLRHDLNLTKKSARWVLKLLIEHMKKERVTTSKDFWRWFASAPS
jgi:hypothetical protein